MNRRRRKRIRRGLRQDLGRWLSWAEIQAIWRTFHWGTPPWYFRPPLLPTAKRHAARGRIRSYRVWTTYWKKPAPPHKQPPRHYDCIIIDDPDTPKRGYLPERHPGESRRRWAKRCAEAARNYLLQRKDQP